MWPLRTAFGKVERAASSWYCRFVFGSPLQECSSCRFDSAALSPCLPWSCPPPRKTAQPACRTAFARAQHLRHGINASEWFAQSASDYSAARTNRYTDAGDIALMAQLGFDNVRLSIDPAPLEQYPHGLEGLNADFLARLDRAVDTMLADGLAVQIDLHPEDSYKQQLRDERRRCGPSDHALAAAGRALCQPRPRAGLL